ncbi:MAG: DEAD/DEAH box helicase [Desulfobulbaceae bacterium]|nr:DEAD/DEAH box helicase [Desulfobulbaceae bacterium]
MYNALTTDTFPIRLPIAVTILLKPWFETEVLDKGLQLIKERALTSFFIYRNSAGGQLFEKYELHLIYEKNNKISQGFTIKTEYCELCGYKNRQRRCEHLAALALLTLAQPCDAALAPMPLTFKLSRWYKVAEFLNNWLSREKGQMERLVTGESIKYKRTAKEGLFEATIPTSLVKAWPFFDQTERQQPEQAELYRIYKELQTFSFSQNEKQLVARGQSSRALKRDTSAWSHICALFYCIHGDDGPEVSYDRDSGFFTLTSKGISFCPTLDFKVTLPKHRSYEILMQLGLKHSGFKILPPVRQGFEVKQNDTGQILVSPLAHLQDKQVTLISKLADHKFGTHYFLPDEGFFQLEKTEPEAQITRDSPKNTTTPLFDFIKQDNEFTVDKEEINDFLKKNIQSLRHSDNRVDEKILSLKFTSIPDGLVILDFQEDQDWFYLSCDYCIGDEFISLDEMLEQGDKSGSVTVGSTTLNLKKGPLSWFHKIATERTGATPSGHTGVRLSRGEFVSLIANFDKIDNKLKNDHFKSRLQNIINIDSWNEPNQFEEFPHHLRNYQKNGTAWLHTLYKLGLGGILADDMGLGKTHQALAMLASIAKKKNQQHPMLVVCPASVLMHWAEKIDQFYPELEYHIHYGIDRDFAKGSKTGLVITTYGIVRSEQTHFQETPFELIVLDELQTLKNRKTAIHKTINSLAARIKIGLSGTPIENSLTDLYALFEICLPGFFGSFERFNQNYLVPITHFQSVKQKTLLSRQVQPFILRRLRSQVLPELPDLIEDDRACELSNEQVQLYQDTIDAQQFFLEHLMEEDENVDYLHILAMITRLKQICNHPCLLEKCKDPYKYKSGKWDLFVELLEECLASGRKVVVFTQYTGMLDLMQTYLNGAGIEFAELRGSMSVVKRKKMMMNFSTNKNCKIFCSSLLAGGTGIDLIAGQVVIHYDRWWNPAKEEQATARVHRMGQKDVVQLFRLITKGTLEEKINTIISKKQQLGSSIIKEDEAGLIKRLDRSQLRAIFSNIS